jgi:7-cyano-7-deazaguanine synthase in queuosine biosynthesis
MGKTLFVLWSGGVDSTYLLQRCLSDPQYGHVFAGHVVVENNAAKAEAELRAIDELVPLLYERYGHFSYLGVVQRVHFTKTNPNLAFKQVPVWLLALIAALHPPVDEVALGYIRNRSPEPDVTAHIDDIQRIYAACQPLMHRPMPRLVFPLLDVDKAEVLSRIDPALRDLCVYCEYPVKQDDGRLLPCGRCRVCRHRAEIDAQR